MAIYHFTSKKLDEKTIAFLCYVFEHKDARKKYTPAELGARTCINAQTWNGWTRPPRSIGYVVIDGRRHIIIDERAMAAANKWYKITRGKKAAATKAAAAKLVAPTPDAAIKPFNVDADISREGGRVRRTTLKIPYRSDHKARTPKPAPLFEGEKDTFAGTVSAITDALLAMALTLEALQEKAKALDALAGAVDAFHNGRG